MARKVSGRWEHELGTEATRNSGIKVTLTRQGIDIFGWYDTFVGIEGKTIPWAEFDAARYAVMNGITEEEADHAQ